MLQWTPSSKLQLNHYTKSCITLSIRSKYPKFVYLDSLNLDVNVYTHSVLKTGTLHHVTTRRFYSASFHARF